MLIYSLRQTAKILIVALGLLMLPSIFAVFVDETTLGDMPIYDVNRGYSETHVMLFDPVNRLSTPILRLPNHTRLQLSVHELLAFTRFADRSFGDLYVMDIRRPLMPPLNVTKHAEIHFAEPLAWSPDGRYLAIEFVEEHPKRSTYVWDGEQFIDITPSNPQPFDFTYHVGELVWSHDGRLAFTHTGQFREIYVWDGQTTINLSRDLPRDDHAPTWDHTGRLAFVSKANIEDSKIIVWDGASLADGLPDKATFVEVAPELTNRFSIPVWTPDGRLTFTAFDAQIGSSQIYAWDGQTTSNLSQNPDSGYGTPVWSADGRWAFQEYPSGPRLITVRDPNNHTPLQTAGEFSPAWSAKGQLLFCQSGKPKQGISQWSLQMWDGKEVFEVTSDISMGAQWPGGTRVSCFY